MKTRIVAAAALALALTACSDKDSVEVSTAPGTAGDFKKNVGDRVHFDFDRACISEASSAQLKKQADWLKQYPNTKATIVGKCDERGGREYNIALGQKRADNASTVLKQHGASGVTTVSYGKDRPEVANATTEEQHAQNRVAVTEING
ncbi:MAG: OmpA family protein [Proteobacteria bacterium]|nr:OmpA family protein [Pseudomonadota bacterium]